MRVLDSLQDIEMNLNMLQLITDPDKYKIAVEHVNDFKKKRAENRNNIKNGITENSEEVKDNLTDTDKELLEFMYEQPMTIKETEDMKNVGRFILPTVDSKKITKIVDKVDKKPKLGFK